MPLITRKKRYPEEREQFRVMAAAGVPYKMIQTALGVSRATIFLWREEMGIPARTRGRKPKAVR